MPVKKIAVKPPEMISIPASKFGMGTSDEQVEKLVEREEWAEEWYNKDMFQVEQPQHLLTMPAFEIAHFPVTNGEYYVFVWETSYRMPRTWLGFHYNEEEVNHPVTGITREDALAYIQWLNKRIPGIQPYRLPTEAEWEFAARGNHDVRVYPWGDEFDPWRCNTLESGRHLTSEVGLFSPIGDSPWGISDMAGNVWEWTSSLFRPYPYDPNDGRENLNTKDKCVVRGGSWYYTRKLARCSAREGLLSTFTSPALGFRLARSI